MRVRVCDCVCECVCVGVCICVREGVGMCVSVCLCLCLCLCKRLRLYPRFGVKCIARVPRHEEPRMIDIGQSSASQGSEATVAIKAEGVVLVNVVVRCVCAVVR